MAKIRKIVYGIGAVTSIALAGKGCLEMSRFSNAQELIEDYEATSSYIELKALADVDGNGKLSEIERKLMFTRLDEYKYGIGGNWPWKDVVKNVEERIDEGGRMYWTPKDRSRISHALTLYKQDKLSPE